MKWERHPKLGSHKRAKEEGARRVEAEREGTGHENEHVAVALSGAGKRLHENFTKSRPSTLEARDALDILSIC